jgi:hypothetical protein
VKATCTTARPLLALLLHALLEMLLPLLLRPPLAVARACPA